jgi:hypothetical protein
MPGPVSDSYDPEWGTLANAESIEEALDSMYDRVSGILGQEPPVDIRVLVAESYKRSRLLPATLTEWEWRIVRFALECASDSI